MKSCKRSSRARCSLADLTSLNPNVLFELGYAVAQHKRTWLLLDTSVTAAKADFNELRLLSTVGYKRYTNSEHVVRGGFKEKPQTDLRSAIFESHIKPSISPNNDPKLLYLKSLWNTEFEVKTIADDPSESAFQT
jgi:hypothetical protein